MDTYIVFWLAATVVFVLVELMTVGLHPYGLRQAHL